MKLTLVFLVTSLILISRPQTAPAKDQPLQVVPHVDLARYAGLWYETARLPNRFQKDCSGEVTATYTLREDGAIDVVNRCRTNEGTIEARGLAKVDDEQGRNSVLRVRFAPAFLSFLPQVWGDYQILALASDYSYALVGSANRKYLWVLSRSREIDAGVYNRLIEEARRQGFPVEQVRRTTS